MLVKEKSSCQLQIKYILCYNVITNMHYDITGLLEVSHGILFIEVEFIRTIMSVTTSLYGSKCG